MAGITDGQLVNATSSNAAWLAKNGNDTAAGDITLASSATTSGTTVTSSQQEHNSIASFVGKALNSVKNDLPAWASNIVGSASQTIKARIDSIVAKFTGTGGHAHTGVDGDGTKIAGSSLASAVPVTLGGTGATGQTTGFNALSPLSAKGDLIIYDGTNNVRQAVGGDGTVWTADSTTSVGAAWKASSGGSGQGGINFLILDSSWNSTKTSNSDAEVSVGDWAAYADAAATTPVDMTGGTPATTIVRSTTAGDLLNGAASLVISKAASNKQGEGVSVTGYVPTAYRLSRCKIQFPWKVTSGSIASGDLKVFIYDVTNSQLITPFEVNGLVGGQGTYLGYFDPVSTTAQLRVGIHVASTSAVAFTMSIDDVKVGPNDVVRGLAGSNWTAYTPTFTGLGTVSAVSVQYRRIGDSIQIQGRFTNGTNTAVVPKISLPSGLSIDGTKLQSSLQAVGYYATDEGSVREGRLLADTSFSSTELGLSISTTTAQLTRLTNASTQLGSTTSILIWAELPIAGWDANVSMGDSSKFNISSFLANGTRVTSTPTALGQYRTYQKTINSAAGTDNAPTTAPTVADGMHIYGVGFNAAGTSGQSNRWEIFIGANKQWKIEAWANTGHSLPVDITPAGLTSAALRGLDCVYDKATGILVVDAMWAYTGSETVHNVGFSAGAAGAGSTVLTDCYFDVVVSDNVLAVGVQSVRSEVFVTGFTGRGSTNTAIARLTTTQKNVGTGITYADSATLGGSFTVNEDGLYNVNLNSPSVSTPIQWWGISLNSSQLTTDISSINASDRIATCKVATVAGVGNLGESCSVTLHLNAGDVIRVHMTPSTPTLDQDVTSFRITKVNV